MVEGIRREDLREAEFKTEPKRREGGHMVVVVRMVDLQIMAHGI